MSNVVEALGTQMIDSHVEDWDKEVEVRWEIQDIGMAEARASVIMMYLRKMNKWH